MIFNRRNANVHVGTNPQVCPLFAKEMHVTFDLPYFKGKTKHKDNGVFL